MTSRERTMSELEHAITIALNAHAGQEDKADEPYIRHPLRVMQQMNTETGRIVAVLHDVVEDADYTLNDIEERFGGDVRSAVDALTKRDHESYPDFIERATENPIARRVKLADIEDNMDVTRLDEVSEAVWEKQKDYHDAWITLRGAERAAADDR